MKGLVKLLAAALIAVVAAVPAQAQFRWGVKAGVAVNSLKFNKDVIDSDNRAGFTGGLMTEFTIPVVGLAFDASVMYAQRSLRYSITDESTAPHSVTTNTDRRHYIDIPINFKYKIGLPLVGKIVTPYLTTGPDFSFLMSSKNAGNAIKNRKFDCAWTVGAGLQLVNHLQIGATYGFGLTKSASGDNAIYSGKNRCWTITAAYLF